MRHLPIHWSEGMFLRPQHFQANDRHWQEQHAVSSSVSDPCSYGFSKLEIDEAALANRQLVIRACQARFRDGTLLSFEQGDQLDRIGLEDAAEQVAKLATPLDEPNITDSEVRAYLAIPRHSSLEPNVSPPGDNERSRSSLTRHDVTDDTSGTNEQEVEFRRLNVRVLLSTEDLSGYELLPLAQIRGLANRETTPEIAPSFFPPCLSINAWAPLYQDVVRTVYDMIGRKVEVLAEQATLRQVGFSSSEPGDLDRLTLLSKLLEAQGVLRVTAFAPGIHPRQAYAELCRVVGSLAVFEPDRRLGEILPYDHDDLATIFRAIMRRIDAMLNRVTTLDYEQRYFVGSGHATLMTTLDTKWLQADWQCYVGVLRGDMAEETCHRLLTGDNHLDWKLGSAEDVDRVFRLGLPGLELKPAEQLPRPLPTRNGWLYYQITTESAAWQAIKLSQSMGMRLRDTLITNPDQLPNHRRVEVAFEGRKTEIEFAIFAVPKTGSQ